MLLHENEKCPVCDRLFTANDDIVVCPECATPHHRECYNKLGRCVNADKHGEAFVYTKPQSVAAEPQDNREIELNPNNSYYSQEDSDKVYCKSCGTQIKKNEPFCYNCGAKQDFPEYYDSPFFTVQSSAYDSADTIDGRSVKDISDVVKSNSLRFIKKFRAGKKISWNWAAFFFGAYYLFFRKMYKEGAIAMAVNLIISLVVNGVYVKQISALENAYTSLFRNGSSITPEQMQAYADELLPVINNAMPALIISVAATLIIGIIIALFADSMYKARVMSILSKAENEASANSEDEGFRLIQLNTNMNMSKEQMRSFYLNRMGGTSIFSPIMAYFVLNFISSIISKL